MAHSREPLNSITLNLNQCRIVVRCFGAWLIVVSVIVNDEGLVKAIRHIPNAFSVAAW